MIPPHFEGNPGFYLDLAQLLLKKGACNSLRVNTPEFECSCSDSAAGVLALPHSTTYYNVGHKQNGWNKAGYMQDFSASKNGFILF